MKVWKKAMRKVSGLTLCGKRIQQYCDINKDNSISQSEWTKCLDVAMGRQCMAAKVRVNSFLLQKIQILR